MLSSLAKEHEVKVEKLRAEQEIKKKIAQNAAHELTQGIVDHLNIGVAQAYINEKKLDAEMRTLTQNAARFTKETQNWLGLIDNFNSALKELGHVQSWAKAIESDVKIITSSLEYVYKSTTSEDRVLDTSTSGSI